MKIAKQIPAYLLGALFTVFGLMYFFKMMPEPKLEGLPLDYMKVMGASKYMDVIKALEVIGGILLLFPRTRGIGICIIVPIVVNIFLFEILIAKEPGIGIALLIVSALAIYFDKDRFGRILNG
jgi:putative oxidoreductase